MVLLLCAGLVRAGALAARLGTGDEGLAVDGPLPAKVQVGIPVDKAGSLALRYRYIHSLMQGQGFRLIKSFNPQREKCM